MFEIESLLTRKVSIVRQVSTLKKGKRVIEHVVAVPRLEK